MNKIYLFILCMFCVFFNPNHSLSAFPKQSPEINGNFIKDLRYNTALTAKIGCGMCALSFFFATSILFLDKSVNNSAFSKIIPADELSIEQFIRLLAIGACVFYDLEKLIRPKG